MGEVGIHFKDEFVVPLQGPFEAANVGSPQSLFLFPVKNMDVVVFGCHGIENLPRPIGRVVVYKQDIDLARCSSGGVGNWANVVTFVIRRNNDQRFFHAQMLVEPSLKGKRK
jgi:hypothetical protein